MVLRVFSSFVFCNNLFGFVYLSCRKFIICCFVFFVYISLDNVVLIFVGWNKLRNFNNVKCIWKLCGNLVSLFGGKKFLIY